MSTRLCEVCFKAPSIGVAAVPGMPISLAFCRQCLDEERYPYCLVVSNTAMVGGFTESAPWWQEIVEINLKLHGKTREEFDRDVVAESTTMWDDTFGGEGGT